MLVCSILIWSNDDILRNNSHKLHYAPMENIEDKHLATHEKIAPCMGVIISDHFYSSWGVGSFKEVFRKLPWNHLSLYCSLYSTNYSWRWEIRTLEEVISFYFQTTVLLDLHFFKVYRGKPWSFEKKRLGHSSYKNETKLERRFEQRPQRTRFA